ncbi:divergent PAP2 family protein [Chloroflexota bacterium]
MSSVLLISVCAWAVAQLLKVTIGLAREKRLVLRYFVTSGGMPSAHSAMVSALATAAAITQGLNSVAFAIAAVVAMVVMYDAAGVRLAVSRQSVILDRVVRELLEKRPRDEVGRDLRRFIGHTPFQVIAGAVLGFLTAWLWLTIGGS